MSTKKDTFDTSPHRGTPIELASREILGTLNDSQRRIAESMIQQAMADRKPGEGHLSEASYRQLSARMNASYTATANQDGREIITGTQRTAQEAAAARATLAVLREADLITESRSRLSENGDRNQMPRVNTPEAVQALVGSLPRLSYLRTTPYEPLLAQNNATQDAPTTVRVQRGDTLAHIAGREDLKPLHVAAQNALGPDAKPADVTRLVVATIALTNNIKDPNKINAGATLTLPSDDQVRELGTAMQAAQMAGITPALQSATTQTPAAASQQVSRAPTHGGR